MTTSTLTFSEAQDHAISLMAIGTTKVDTAIACKVSRETIYAWLKIPDFKEKLNKEKSQLVMATREQLQSLLPKSVDIVKKVLNDPENKSLGRVLEMLWKSTGVLDSEQSVNILILNSTSPIGKLQEMKKMMIDLYDQCSPEERLQLMESNQETVDSVGVVVNE